MSIYTVDIDLYIANIFPGASPETVIQLQNLMEAAAATPQAGDWFNEFNEEQEALLKQVVGDKIESPDFYMYREACEYAINLAKAHFSTGGSVSKRIVLNVTQTGVNDPVVNAEQLNEIGAYSFVRTGGGGYTLSFVDPVLVSNAKVNIEMYGFNQLKGASYQAIRSGLNDVLIVTRELTIDFIGQTFAQTKADDIMLGTSLIVEIFN